MIEPDEGCSCCGFEGAVLTHYPCNRAPQAANCHPQGMDLCALCAGTLTSNADCYRYDEARVMQTICYVGNAILAALKPIASAEATRGDDGR